MSRRFTGFPPEVKATIRERAEERCERCGVGYSDCVAHHRRPRKSGGTKRPETNQPSNGVWLCGACHNIVESYRTQAFEDGFLVRDGDDPLGADVDYRKYSDEGGDRLGRVLLDDEGFTYRVAS